MAVRWASEKFYLYLYEVEFDIRTDLKLLVVVLGEKLNPVSARIERWLSYLKQFQDKFTHIRGIDKVADFLGRLPVGQIQDDAAKDTEEFAYKIASGAVPAALVP